MVNAYLDGLPVVVVGAGPVGLAAGAHLHERGLPFLVLEARAEAGTAAGGAPRSGPHLQDGSERGREPIHMYAG